MLINLILIIIILIVVLLLLYKALKSEDKDIEEQYDNIYTIESLLIGVKEAFDDILNKNIADLNLNKTETIKRENMKSVIRQSLRICNHGDKGAKEYVKDYIKDIIQRRLSVNEENIDKYIEFDNIETLNPLDKFEIILHLYKKQYKYEGLTKLITKYNLDDLKHNEKDEYYEISIEDINLIYKKESPILSYLDKLEILTQRIYALYKGLGVIDEIRDMKIDGVSGGISGIPNDFYYYELEYLDNGLGQELSSFNSVWIFYKGKTIKLSFLGFASQRELVRVCKNIYRHGNPGQLSQARGFIANEMKDGSRVVTFRPPFSASWAFLVRKFDSIERKDIKYLITDEGCEYVITLIEYLVKSYQDIIITGSQGCGKTTLMMALLQFFSRTCNLRLYELIFELFPQKIYPKMNILSLRETGTVYGQDALDIIKKTDGDVTMIGEIATYEAANWLIETSQVASKSVLGTHHAVTTDDLIDYFRNAALRFGGFKDETIAQRQAIRAINFDIHMVKDRNGYRYIERITEVIPIESIDSYKSYKTLDIIKFEEDRYIVANMLSNECINRMKKYLDKGQIESLKMTLNKGKGEDDYER